MNPQQLRTLVRWHSEYRPEWDNDAGQYVEHEVALWGKSRRLGLLREGRYKAYIGVQHVDPDRPGWRIVDEPQARFFVSLFVDGACVTLRTFASIADALEMLGKAMSPPVPPP